MDGRFPQPDFLLLDRGRTAGEMLVVLVRDGTYRGFGYAEEDLVGNNLHTLQAAVRPYEDNPEVRRIIRRFMDAGTPCRILPL
jgi:DNA polymerase-3 subunit epsilon